MPVTPCAESVKTYKEAKRGMFKCHWGGRWCPHPELTCDPLYALPTPQDNSHD